MNLTMAKKVLVATVATAAGAIGIAALAGAANASAFTEGESSDMPIVGDALTTASKIAVEHTGGGTVTETEVEDEDSYYEVEVTLPDGSQVDVQLDEEFNVVGTEADDLDEASDDD